MPSPPSWSQTDPGGFSAPGPGVDSPGCRILSLQTSSLHIRFIFNISIMHKIIIILKMIVSISGFSIKMNYGSAKEKI